MMSTLLAEAPAHTRKEARPSHVAAQPVCWCVTDGSAGTMAQVKALAAALGYEPLMKRVLIRKPLVLLPNHVVGGALQKMIPSFMHCYEPVASPWPDVIISCGRRGALASLGIKSRMRKEKIPRTIHIHDPQMRADAFDIIIAMQHDKIHADNVIKTNFALHNITPDILAKAAEKFARRFTAYAKPYAAVLLGGSTNKYHLTASRMTEIITILQRTISANSVSLLITASRRTGTKNLKALSEAFPRVRDSRVYLYDGISENPYLGMLAFSDHIIVSNDSVNMMSEAVATGKPVYILRLPGHENTKPARFAERLIADGIARPLEGMLERWSYSAGNEMPAIAADVRKRLGV